jgi:hypothetical protein
MNGKKLALCAALLGGPIAAHAQEVVAPGDEARRNAQDQIPAQPRAEDTDGYNAFEAPPIDVHGKKALKEEELIGDYAQPRWTARRRFPTTRIYVAPKGQFAFEWWNRTTSDLDHFDDSNGKSYRNYYEMELGLGHRLQLDTYLVTNQDGTAPPVVHEESIELRYALADWGVIWANPTLYVEYAHGEDGPILESKLLFGGELAEGLHGGLNLVLERQWNGPQTHEYRVSGGISKTIVDTEFSFGAEAEVQLVDDKDNRFDFFEKQYLLGPSLSWQPTHHMHILVNPLFGVVQEKNAKGDFDSTTIWRNWLVVGWDT